MAQYITDDKGNQIGVVLSAEKYQMILKEVEKVFHAWLYNKTGWMGSAPVPMNDVLKETERKRKKK
jgi:hypothetical protein